MKILIAEAVCLMESLFGRKGTIEATANPTTAVRRRVLYSLSLARKILTETEESVIDDFVEKLYQYLLFLSKSPSDSSTFFSGMDLTVQGKDGLKFFSDVYPYFDLEQITNLLDSPSQLWRATLFEGLIESKAIDKMDSRSLRMPFEGALERVRSSPDKGPVKTYPLSGPLSVATQRGKVHQEHLFNLTAWTFRRIPEESARAYLEELLKLDSEEKVTWNIILNLIRDFPDKELSNKVMDHLDIEH